MSVWHGEKKALRTRRQVWTSEGVIEFQNVYEGQVSALQAAKPTAGSLYADSGCYVENVELVNTGEADKGVLTVSGSNRTTISRDEIEWLRVDQDLRYHPIYQTGGSKALTQSQRERIEKALQSQDADDIAAITGNAVHLYVRLLRGESGYPVYIPICRRTAFYVGVPTSTGCGHEESPPFTHPVNSGNGKAYHFIKTADRAVRVGWLWERCQEWTGFEQIDTDIISAT